MKTKKFLSFLMLFALMAGVIVPILPSLNESENILINQTTTPLDPITTEIDTEEMFEWDKVMAATPTQDRTPTVGNVSMLVILVEFSDTPWTIPADHFRDMWNGTTSVRSYYYEASYGKLNLNITVTDWLHFNRTKAEFKQNSIDIHVAYDWGIDQIEDQYNPDEFAYHYLHWSGDSTFDTPFWPHVEGIGIYLGFGAEVDRPTIPEPRGTQCHEFGHMLGLSDYYDTNYDNDDEYWNNVAYWDLMGAGGYNGGGDYPAHHSIFSKLLLGWLDPETVYHLKEGEVANIKIVPQELAIEGDLEPGYYYGARIRVGSVEYMFEYRGDYGTDHYLNDHGLMWGRIEGGLLRYIGSGYNYDFYLTRAELEDHEARLTNTEINTEDDDPQERFFQFEMTPFMASAVVKDDIPAQDGMPASLDITFDLTTNFENAWNLVEDVAANTTYNFDFTDQNQGDILNFKWDIVDPALDFIPRDDDPEFREPVNMTFYQKSGETWIEVASNDEVYHDCFEYTFPADGDYRISIDHIDLEELLDIWSITTIYEKPEYEISISQDELAYMIGDSAEFELDIVLENTKTGWLDYDNLYDGSLTLTLPDEISIASSTGTYDDTADLPIFYNHPVDKTYILEASATGEYNITINYDNYGISGSINKTIVISEDTVKPTFELNKANAGTKFATFLVQWSASDSETGMGHYDFLIDGELVDQFYTSIKSSYSIDIPDAEGEYNLTVIAYDKANNSVSDSMHIFYDGTRPELLSISGEGSDGEYTIQLTISEALSFPVTLKIFFDENLFLEVELTEEQIGAYEFTVTEADLDDLGIENYAAARVKISLYDNLDNSNTSYSNFGSLVGLVDDSNDDDKNDGTGFIPGYAGILFTSLLGFGIVFGIVKKSRK